jgi:MFS family permease
MDRLDTWLNAQRGRRRLAVIGVSSHMPTFCLGFCVLGFCVLGSSSSLPMPVAAIVAIALLAIPAAVGFGSIMAVIYSRRARNPRRKKGLPPFFMWRQIALPWLLIPTLLNATLLNTQDRSTPLERALALLQVISSIAIIALALETYRYSRRFARSREAGQPTLAEE